MTEKKKGRAYHGQAKLAPVNMHKDATQFVIDGYMVEEVLKQIPNDVKIYGASIALRTHPTSRRITVPNSLKTLGVTRMVTIKTVEHAWLTFDETTPATIRKNTKAVCEHMQQPYEKAYFNYLTLSHDGATGRFKHCTKEVRPHETDQRKKLRVLGLTTGTGRIQSLISHLGAKKYRCEVREEAVRLMMCSQE